MSMQNKDHYVAIMAGGIGSRFWPMSRTALPKQFLDVLNTGKTLVQWTYERYIKFIPAENIYIVTSEEYVEIVKTQLPMLPVDNILAEPSKKNTAPCIAYISFKLAQINPDAKCIVAPSDHLILEEDRFQAIALDALDFVDHIKALVTLGIQPTHPNTGYGYIQYEGLEVAKDLFKVKTFTEKPDLEIAKSFLESGDFLWNAGIFAWKVSSILTAFEKYQPEMFELFDQEKMHFNTPAEKAAIQKIYPQCTNISIDIAIMEKANNVYVMPASFGWSDLGTWNSAYENMEKDYFGNAVASDNVIVIDATKCMINSPKNKLVVVQGLDDFIVVDTKDVLLICSRDKEQSIKEYVAEVKRNKGDKYI
jgi:mannose-1-phosphate guanylyltransferase